MLIELNRGIKLMESEREIGFLVNQVEEMLFKIKSLEYDLAEMVVENNQLRERVKKLATRPASARRTMHRARSNKHNNK